MLQFSLDFDILNSFICDKVDCLFLAVDREDTEDTEFFHVYR